MVLARLEFTWASGANIVIVHAYENFGNYLQGVSLVSFWEKVTFRRLVLRCSTPNVLVALASCLPQPGFRKLEPGWFCFFAQKLAAMWCAIFKLGF